MIFAKVRVTGLCAVCTCRQVIPVGLIGGVVEFDFADPMWDGYTKNVVFKGVGTMVSILNGNIAVIPQEAIARKGAKLKVGIYGTDADKTVGIPTFWADLGVVMDAADPNGDPAADPQLPIWAQLEAEIKRLKENGVTDEQVARVVEDYLTENPVEVLGVVKTVNGTAPDENGNVEITIPDSGGNAENGEDGFSPIATVTQTGSGAVISITDTKGTTEATITNGKDGKDGADGSDYVLTDADKTEIADKVLVALPTWTGGSY